MYVSCSRITKSMAKTFWRKDVQNMWNFSSQTFPTTYTQPFNSFMDRHSYCPTDQVLSVSIFVVIVLARQSCLGIPEKAPHEQAPCEPCSSDNYDSIPVAHCTHSLSPVAQTGAEWRVKMKALSEEVIPQLGLLPHIWRSVGSIQLFAGHWSHFE